MLPLVSTSYLPPTSYMALLLQNKGARLEIEENFEKQSYRNRCVIYTAQGEQILTVPVQSGNSKTLIKDLKISYQENWPVLHWRALLSAYKGRPFFDVLADDLEVVFLKRPEFLLDLNLHMLAVIIDWLQADIKITSTDKFEIPKSEALDFRSRIHPKKESVLLSPPHYFQQFSSSRGFIADLSVIDLIFSEGRAAWDYLHDLKISVD